MKNALHRRLGKLERAGGGVESLTDAELHRGIELYVAKLAGRTLTAAEQSELTRIASKCGSAPSGLDRSETIADVQRFLEERGYLAGLLRRE